MKTSGFDRLASVQLTLVCLALAMALVVLGTLAQVHMGTFAAQKEFFNSWWIFVPLGEMKIPAFPGGLAVGAAWMINLIAAFIARFRFRLRDAGNLLSHAGLVFLLAGQFLTQTLAHESNMPVEVGQTRNYSESFSEMELALVMTSDPQIDRITSIPYSFFNHEGRINPPGLPFSLLIKRFYANAQLGMVASPQPSPDGRGRSEATGEAFATQGVGTRIAVQDIPPTSNDDEMNVVTAFIEVTQGDKNLGTWLVSSGLGAPQSFAVDGKDYQLYIRPKRHYYPFALTLKEFNHDIYPGTDIPKNFSSLVHLSDARTGESRDTLIYMNHPLRYQGKTFYQASFGKGDQLSVLQVVDNPASWAPYFSCALIVFGLLVQFLFHLFEFLRKRS